MLINWSAWSLLPFPSLHDHSDACFEVACHVIIPQETGYPIVIVYSIMCMMHIMRMTSVLNLMGKFEMVFTLGRLSFLLPTLSRFAFDKVSNK